MTPWSRFVKRVGQLDQIQKVGSEGSPFYGDLSAVESIVHELCHWVALGYTLPRVAPEIDLATITARILRDLDPRARNSNECIAIGAEILILADAYPNWSDWHRTRLLTYARNGLDTDGVHRTEDGFTGVTAYAKTRLARADRTQRARRVAAAVRRAIAAEEILP